MSLFSFARQGCCHHRFIKGIGRAIAERMAEQGAKVVISSRKADACAEVAAAINARFGDGTAISLPANISSKQELQALVDGANARFGKIDIPVCNAAAIRTTGRWLASATNSSAKSSITTSFPITG